MNCGRFLLPFYRQNSNDTRKEIFISGSGSGCAQWQLGGLDSLFTNVNPGQSVRIAFAVDMPDDTGPVLLKTDVGKTVEPGNFAAMASEDN